MFRASSRTELVTFWALGLAAAALVACNSETERLSAALPHCESVCVAQPQLSAVLELAPDGLSLWRDGVSTSLEGAAAVAEWAKGANSARHVPVLCHGEVEGDRLLEVLGDPVLRGRTAVSLAGFDGSEVGFGTFRIFDRDHADSRSPASELATDKLRPDNPWPPSCARGAVEPCPIVVIDTRQYTCAEIVGAADVLASRGRLLGLAR